MLQAMAVVLIVAADQIIKYFVRTGIPLHETKEFVKGILSLTYVRNTGASFSFMSEHTWILTVISAVLSVVIAAVLIRRVVKHPVAVWSLTAVLGGAIGNLIDRVWLGYVVDMFQTEFMEFAVFNLADIFITWGGAVFIIYLLFIYKDKDKKKDSGDGNT